MDDIRCVVRCDCVLGEGPLWDERAGRLYWFDIKGRRLHWVEPDGATAERRELAVQVSAATLRSAGGMLVASERGLEILDPESGGLELIEAKEEDLDGFRSNDGKIDVRGVFWWSVMDDDGGRRPGRVYRKAPGLPSRRVLDGIHIANTLSTSPDGRTLYLADTADATLYAYPVDDAGELGRRRRSRPWATGQGRRTGQPWTNMAASGTPNGAGAAWFATGPMAGSTGSWPCRSASPPAARSAAPT